MATQKDVPKQDLVITHVFDAPLDKVWRAWIEPEQVKQWWGPDRFTCPSCRMDFKEGGTTLVCMRAPKEFGGRDMYSTWHYRRIDPMRLIEYIHNLSDENGRKIDPATLGMPPDFPQDQRHTIAFRALEGKRTELTVTEYQWTVGQMMEMSRLGMGQCLAKMAKALVKPSPV